MPNSGPMFQTRHDLDQNVRRSIVDNLNQRLAETLDLYTQVKQAHWNIKGPNFFQLHELFDQLAEEIFPYVDRLAERATALGGYALGTARMAASASSLPEFPRDASDERQILDAVIDRYSRYIAANRRAMGQSDQDLPTQDLYIEIGQVADKHLYFLESHVQSSAQRAG